MTSPKPIKILKKHYHIRNDKVKLNFPSFFGQKTGARKVHRSRALLLYRPQRSPKSLQAELLLQRRRQRPRQHGSTVPVHDGHQIDEAVGRSDVRDFGALSVVRSVDRDYAQQVRISLVKTAWNTHRSFCDFWSLTPKLVQPKMGFFGF